MSISIKVQSPDFCDIESQKIIYDPEKIKFMSFPDRILYYIKHKIILIKDKIYKNPTNLLNV